MLRCTSRRSAGSRPTERMVSLRSIIRPAGSWKQGVAVPEERMLDMRRPAPSAGVIGYRHGERDRQRQYGRGQKQQSNVRGYKHDADRQKHAKDVTDVLQVSRSPVLSIGDHL